jgi:hypothetical protein
MHCSRRDSGTPILTIRRVLLHWTLWLESRSHATTHVLVRDGAVGLRGLVRHVGLVVLGWETTASSCVRGKAAVHVCIAHVTVRRLGGLAAQMLSLRKRVGLAGHAVRARLSVC